MPFPLLLALAFLSQTPAQQTAPAAPRETSSQSQTMRPVRIAAAVLDRLAVHKTQPAYPAQAAQQHLQGAVVLRVLLDTRIQEATAMSGPDIFRQPALEAAKKWQYKPFLLNGQPTPVESTVVVTFR